MNTLNGLIPCIVSGGSGTRLWPVSRQNMPKPFMRMRDGQIRFFGLICLLCGVALWWWVA